MSDQFIKEFKDIIREDIAIAGGKGANLGEMTKGGFEVPGGFVITTEAYDFFSRKEERKILDLASGADEENPLKTEEISRSIKNIFLISQIPGNIREQILAAYTRLIEDSSSLVAVRSSATAEDLPSASFAGQQETILNVQGKELLLKAVKSCWASLWSARAMTYRLSQGISPKNVSMGVVIQRQIPSDISGVAFSLNPQNNCYDEAVINANWGLGESVVSGQVTPDTFVVDTVTKEILEKKISSKDISLWADPDGGIVEKANPYPLKASLTDQQALSVAELARKVETYYTIPMDIEWTFEGDRLFLLQARPITTYFPLAEEITTAPGELKKLYSDNLLTKQGCNYPFSMLGSKVYEELSTVAVKGQFGMDILQGLSVVAGQRFYFNIGNAIKTLGLNRAAFMSGSGDRGVEEIIKHLDYKPYLPSKKSPFLKGGFLTILKLIFKLLPAFVSTMKKPEIMKVKYLAGVEASKKRMAAIGTNHKTFGEFNEALFDWFSGLLDIETTMGMMLGPIVCRGKLKKMFKDQKARGYLIDLEMALPGNPTAEMGELMYELAAFPEVQTCSNGREFEDKLKNREFSPRFLKAWDNYINRYGCRGIGEIDPATPRAYERLPEFFKELKVIIIAPPGEESLLDSAKRRQEEAYNALLAIAEKKGFRKKFVKYAGIIRTFAGHREEPKYLMILAIDLMRKKLLELADRLVARGRLTSRDQIFHLTLKEVAAGEKDETMELIPLVEKNSKYYFRMQGFKEWPSVIDSRGKIFRKPPAMVKDGDLAGEAIAHGIVRGKAKILHDPYEKPVNKGEILVTRATDPGWTPLFMNARGIVLEIGGSLQHGAVIAREYGLPCVSGVEGASSKIKDGQLIEVDGSNGIVRLLGT